MKISDGEIFITERGEKGRKLLVEPYLAEGVTTQGFAFEGLCPDSEANTCLVPEISSSSWVITGLALVIRDILDQ